MARGYWDIFDQKLHEVGTWLEFFIVGLVLLVVFSVPVLYLANGAFPGLREIGLFGAIGFLPTGYSILFGLLLLDTWREYRCGDE